MSKPKKLMDKIRGIIYIRYGDDWKAKDCAQEILKLLSDQVAFVVEKELPLEALCELMRNWYIEGKSIWDWLGDEETRVMLKEIIDKTGWHYVEKLEVKA